MRKALALFFGRVPKKDRRRAQILGQRQRLLHGQERRSRLRDAADGDRRKEGQDEIDVVLGSDHNAVALLEAAFDQPAGELANHQIEVAIGPRTKRARPVAKDQRRLGPRSAACRPRQCWARLKESGAELVTTGSRLFVSPAGVA